MVQQNHILDTYMSAQTFCILHIGLSEFLRSLDTEILWLLLPAVSVYCNLYMWLRLVSLFFQSFLFLGHGFVIVKLPYILYVLKP